MHLTVPLVSIAVKITWTFLAPRILTLFVGSAANKRAANRLYNGETLEINKTKHWGALYRKSTWKKFFGTIFVFALKPILSSSVNGQAVPQYEKMDILKLNGFYTMESKNYGTTTNYKAYFGEYDKCSTLISTNRTRKVESWSGFWFEVKKQKAVGRIVELKPTGRYECKSKSNVFVTSQGWDDREIEREDIFKREVLSSKKISTTVCSSADKGICYAVKYKKCDVIVEGAKRKIGYMIENYFGNLELWVYPFHDTIMVRAFNPRDKSSIQGKWASIKGDVDIRDVISSLSILSVDDVSGNVHDDLRKAYLLGLSSRGKTSVIVTSTREIPSYPGYEIENMTVGYKTEGYISKDRIKILLGCIALLAVLRSIAVMCFIRFYSGPVDPKKLNIENSSYISSLAISRENNVNGDITKPYKKAIIIKRRNNIKIEEIGVFE